MGRRVSGVAIATIASVGIALVGAIVMLTAAPAATATFGWFAYQPLADATFAPGASVVITTAALVGALLLAAGLIGVSGVIGFVWGRRVQVTRTH
ncbi:MULTISPECIES: hypothetical protein [unclassified Microbacterium]|uniref:hypothetical protein n=1 Tax=unclassified Microbacterium TaxID=2609290 RepID=UPI003019FBA6